MINMPITYEDYNGVTRTEDFWFHITQPELMSMELDVEGGLSKMIEEIIKTGDNKNIVTIFKGLILRAYGEKSADGKFFRKTDDEGRPLSRNFEASAAFSELYMKLATDADAAAKFVAGIMPKMPNVDADPNAKKAIEMVK